MNIEMVSLFVLMTMVLLYLWQNHQAFWPIVAMVVLFFAAFNYLEATMPSWLSRIAPAGAKGSAMGVYSTSQFFGAFVGGAFGGWAHQAFGVQGVFLVSVVGAVLWLVAAAGMRAPRQLSSELRGLGKADDIQVDELTDQLLAVPGVVEAVVVPEDGVAYLKVDRKGLELSALDAVLAPEISPQTSPG